MQKRKDGITNSHRLPMLANFLAAGKLDISTDRNEADGELEIPHSVTTPDLSVLREGGFGTNRPYLQSPATSRTAS